ncbi:hypothetical protein JTB14_016139 [Gonioctena quinquepunctata]|nr:hypothetical protein JTB14_016139 [Gonioctena quinquepunctata]
MLIEDLNRNVSDDEEEGNEAVTSQPTLDSELTTTAEASPKEIFAENKQALLSLVSSGKEAVARRNEMIRIIEMMQDTFNEVLSQVEQTNKDKTLVEALDKLEKKVSDLTETVNHLPAPQSNSIPTGYADALKGSATAAKIKVSHGKPIATSSSQVVIFYPKEENNQINTAEETLKTLKQVSPTSVGIKPLKIITLPDKGVKVISSETSLNGDTLDKLGLTAKIVGKSLPRLAVVGVPDYCTLMRVQNRINDELMLRVDDPGEVKALHKFGSKHGTCTWVIEAPPQTRLMLVNKGYTLVDWAKCWVRDHVRVVECYNCQKFGHLAGACKSETACAVCAGPHDTRNCTKESPSKCSNCETAKEEDIRHSAGSQTCPTYRRRLQSKIQNTNYEL